MTTIASRLRYWWILSVLCWLGCCQYSTSFRLHLQPSLHQLHLHGSHRLHMSASTAKKLIVGLNKYSHDTSACILDAQTGEILFAQAKERLSHKKHDGGGVASLLREGLRAIDADIDDIALVVSNNHHFRVKPFEKRLSFSTAIKATPRSYLNEYNLIPKAKHLELSHHLAHAWSAMASAPFSRGMVVVMDGMGESYRAMMEDMLGTEPSTDDQEYMHDLKLLKQLKPTNFNGQPISLLSGSAYREAETAYVFNKETGSLLPVFKRWSRERSPSELYNHGFENMESIGAVYSRLSSHILGNWNACGKVMGLASWNHQKKVQAKDWFYDTQSSFESLELGKKFFHDLKFMTGNPADGSFKINWDVIESLEGCNAFSNEDFDYFAHLAHSVQSNTEDVVMNMLQTLQQQTQESNVILTGGVALNSVLNGKIVKSKLFDAVHVPSAPGDEGIAIGCAMYGLQKYQEMCCKDDETCSQGESGTSKVISFGSAETSAVKAAAEGDHCHDHDHDHDHACTQDVNKPFNFPTSLESPFHGLPITMEDLDEAFYTFDAWINLEALGDEESLVEDAAQALQDGKVIAWFQGRSELGQRALGARSILANPQIAKHRMFINQHVKHREWYRPLAPSVLEDHVRDWFEDIPETCQQYSPFMSFTAMIKSDKISQVPAVAHIDGSARLQSVSERTFPLYHKLISRFFQKTKIPMILNTSLNGKDQPILEKPIDAIKALISSAGSIDYLYVGGYKVSLKTFPFQASSDSLSEEEGTVMIQAQPLYLYETTSTSQPDLTNSATGTIRVRIQDVGTEQLIESEEGEDSMQWLELPSELHLNILQLLQAPPVATEPDTNQEEDDGSVAMDLGNDAKNELATSDLWNAIQQIDVVEDDHDEDEQHEESPSNGLTWTEVRNALRWLYQHALISFEDPFAANDLLDNAFEGAEVVDMRAFS